MSSIICLLCDRNFSSYIGLAKHIQVHNYNSKSYYDDFLKKDSEGICPVCSKKTTYKNMTIGYLKYCSNKCAGPYRYEKSKETNLKKYGAENVYASNYGKSKIKETVQAKYNVDYIWQAEEIKEKCKQIHLDNYGVENVFQSDIIKEKCKESHIKHLDVENPSQSVEIINKKHNNRQNDIDLFEKTNNCTMIDKLVKLYGTGWCQSSLYKTLNIIQYKNIYFLSNDDIVKLKLYNDCHGSYTEYCMYNYLTDNNIEFSHCDRQQIKPYELDFYLPKYKIGIECNGYWHMKECFLYNDNVDRDLLKHKLCTDRGIELIVVTEENMNDVMRTFKL